MRLSSHAKLIRCFPLLALLMLSCTFFGLNYGVTRAAMLSHTSSSKLDGVLTCGAWNVIPSPNVASYSNILYGVTALSAKNAWAVGYYQNESGTIGLTLIEHWNGATWSIVPSANASGAVYSILNKVVALSADNIWAVGYTLYIPKSGSSYDLTLIEHWNGTTWKIVPSLNPGTLVDMLTGVTATSSSDVWAAGYYQNSIQSGDSNPHPLIEHWNGTSWNVVLSPEPIPSGTILTDISAASAKNAWAVGSYSTHSLTEHWDGSTWSIVASPTIGSSYNVLNGVTTSVGGAHAVGYSENANSNGSQSLFDHWNGSRWKASSDPNPLGASSVTLNGVTALAPNNIWAAGYAFNTSTNNEQTLTEHWNGSGWAVVSSPNLGISSNRLNGITRIPGTTQVWTAGFYNGNNGYQTLIEFYC